MTCAACGSDSFSSLHRGVRDFEHGSDATVAFDVCASCGWITQAPLPTQESLNAAYPVDYRPHISARNASGIAGLLRRLKDAQARMLARKIRLGLPMDHNVPILDLGCGRGHLLHALQTEGYRNLTGIDQTATLADAFANSEIHYRSCDLACATDLGGPYGAIIMVNVIEHFLWPADLLALCRKSLTAGGKIIVITPSAAGISHQVFGRYWSGLHAPRHTQVFSPHNFALFARRLRFDPIQLVGLSDPGSWAVSFQNWVRDRWHRSGGPGGGTSWYSLVLLPLWFALAVVENVLRRGSSFLAVLA
jgi:SAM-dependent methyltransferase